MNYIRDHFKAQGYDFNSIVVRGTVVMLPPDSCRDYFPGVFENGTTYPFIKSLEFMAPGLEQPVIKSDYFGVTRSDLLDPIDIERISQSLLRHYNAVTGQNALVSPQPDKRRFMTSSWTLRMDAPTLLRLAEIDMRLQALAAAAPTTGGHHEALDLRYEAFKTTSAYADNPCPFAGFKILQNMYELDEGKEGFDAYYARLTASSALFDRRLQPTPLFADKLEEVVADFLAKTPCNDAPEAYLQSHQSELLALLGVHKLHGLTVKPFLLETVGEQVAARQAPQASPV